MRQVYSARITEAINRAVSPADILERAGLRALRGGWWRCPFHPDREPSLRAWGPEKGWYCFSCRRGGDAIALEMALYGLNFPEAVSALDREYGLGLDTDGGQTPGAARTAAIMNARRKAETQKQREAEALRESEALNALSQALACDRAAQNAETALQAGDEGQRARLGPLYRQRLEANDLAREINFGRIRSP